MTTPLVVVSVAHHPEKGGDPGATWIEGTREYREADWSKAVCERIVQTIALQPDIRCHLIDAPLGATIGHLRRMRGVALAVEPHLNKGGGDYALVIKSGDTLSPLPDAFAALWREETAALRRGGGYSERNRLWSTPIPGADGRLRSLGFLDAHPHPAVITEFGFMDAPDFCKWAFLPAIVEAVAAIHVRALRVACGLSPAFEVQP